MRQPIFRVTCDDDPSDPRYPCAVSLQTIYDNGDNETYTAIYPETNPSDWSNSRRKILQVGQSVTVGGGAAVQFTLKRIR